MKRIIALTLIIGCLLCLASCKKEPEVEPEVDYGPAVAEIQSIVDASAPGIVNILVTHTSDLGELNGTYYVVYNADGSATVTYTYEKFNEFNENHPTDEIKSPYSGTAHLDADGTVYDEEGNDDVLDAVFFELKLDKSKLEDVTVVAGVLKAKIKAGNTAAVLGTAVGGDVKITVVTGTDGITSMSLSYDTLNGHVEISTVYSYPVVEDADDAE